HHGRTVVVELPHAGNSVHDPLRRDDVAKKDAGGAAQVAHLLGAAHRRGGIGGEILVGGADEGELALVGNGEDDAPVGVLKDVGAVVLEQTPHDDVTALDQTH